MLALLVASVPLAAGCATVATFDNGCQGNYADLCRVYVALEARCQSAPEVPDSDRALCAAQARQAYRDDLQQREQQRVRDTSEAIMRGQRSVCGRATGGAVPCGPQPSPPAPTAQDPACYAMSQDDIYYRLYCR